jgi:Leucine-rich repeat (LRR) protein
LDVIPQYVNEHLSDYTSFDFSFNNIVDWPEFSPFKHLQVLRLSGNKLTSIPPQIGILVGLRELYLNGNMLHSLPPEIGDLSTLEKLDISNNSIKKLVDDIGCLIKLEDLNVTGNPLAVVPEAIGECNSIEVSQVLSKLC